MTEPGIIDPKALNDLLETVGGDQAFLAELIDAYLEDSPNQLSTIESALASGRVEELRRAAHSLKSNSANFGAQNLADLCKDLEESARRNELDGADIRLEQIMAEYQKVKQALASVK
jgi:HPt (histidine-containing phosphotransfer) domain-containing protein